MNREQQEEFIARKLFASLTYTLSDPRCVDLRENKILNHLQELCSRKNRKHKNNDHEQDGA